MDVVALAQYGVSQAVATLGTATTPDHAELLFRNAPDVYFCFDGDRAGRGAAWKALESVLPRMKDGRQALFLFLPGGEDPDSLVRRKAWPVSTRACARPPRRCPNSSMRCLQRREPGPASTARARSARTLQAIAGADPRWRLRRPDAAAPDRAHRRRRARQRAAGAPADATRARSGSATAQKPSLVRSAIQHLLHRPAIALELPPPDRYADARQPGIELLHELGIAGARTPRDRHRRPARAFRRPRRSALAAETRRAGIPGEEPALRAEFLGAIAQLEKQVLQQRIDELQQRLSELDEAEKYELRALLQARLQPSGSLGHGRSESAIPRFPRPTRQDPGCAVRTCFSDWLAEGQANPRRCCRCATGCRHGHRRCSRRNRPLSRRDRTPSPPPAWSPVRRQPDRIRARGCVAPEDVRLAIAVVVAGTGHLPATSGTAASTCFSAWLADGHSEFAPVTLLRHRMSACPSPV